MIPCTECICLAVCKQKIEFKCSILYDFMDENIEYDDDEKVVKGSPSSKIWEEVHEIFQKEDNGVSFCKEGMRVGYTVISKKHERRKREGKI